MRYSLQGADSQTKPAWDGVKPAGAKPRGACRRLLLATLALASGIAPGGGATAGQTLPVAIAVPGRPVLTLGSYDLAAQGYAEREFFISGLATAYRTERDPAGLVARADGQHAYRTRIVVVTPMNPRRFNGTVLVEWLNVSTGRDIPIDWIMLHRELLRGGYAYVAVSAQRTGVAGGGAGGPAGPAPKQADPKRYASLRLPGDAFSFSIFSQIGSLLRGDPAILGKLRPRRLLAAGDSQSALYLVTYVNFIDPLTRVYDGYLIHSRPGAAAALNWPSMYAATRRQRAQPVRLRGDLRVPVLQLITETDLTGLAGFVGYAAARQPDGPDLRTWEIPGAAHVDNYLLSGGMIDTPQLPLADLAASWAPRRVFGGITYPALVNNAPQHHYVAEAALVALNRWVATGEPPPHAAPIKLARLNPPLIARDANGNALGGIRTPWMDVPVSTLSGLGGITGSVRPFGPHLLAELYPGGERQYMAEFTADLDRTIAAGFILPADRAEILALARLGYPATN